MSNRTNYLSRAYLTNGHDVAQHTHNPCGLAPQRGAAALINSMIKAGTFTLEQIAETVRPTMKGRGANKGKVFTLTEATTRVNGHIQNLRFHGAQISIDGIVRQTGGNPIA